jgi:predicted RNA-binding protein YlxR (DUF448 family)
MPRKNEPTTRLCAVTREIRPLAHLIRFVCDPEGVVVPDLKRQLPGRGMWVTARRDTVETAIRRKAFARAFEGSVTVDAALPDLIDRLLVEAALGTFGLARKAGSVLTGFAKVEAAIAKEQIAGLVHASEAGEDGVLKLAAALSRRNRQGRDANFRQSDGMNARSDEKNGIPVIRSFSGTQLDLALGRSNVIHAALLAGRASDIFIERLTALDRYRGTIGLPAALIDGQTSGDAPQDTTGS